MANYIYDTTQTTKKTTTLLAQTFGWVTIGLLVTSVISIGLAFLLNTLLMNATSAAQELALMNNYMIVLGAASIVQFVLVLVIQFGVIRKGPMEKNITVPYLLYAANMGIVLSFLVLLVEFDILVSSLAITVILFAMMYLFAKQTKRNLNGLAIVGSSLLIGGLLLALLNFFLRSSDLEWMVSFILFGAIMLITLFDIWQVNKASQAGVTSKNLALFFAFNLYVDFVYIFIRIVYFIALSRSRR